MRAMTNSADALRPHPNRPDPAAPLELPAHVPIAIVGSGFSGLGSAIALANEGYAPRDVLILERRSGVGGTWYDNSYPGCRCDVPSNLYSFSFAPNPNWSETFSGQPEIERYLQSTARRYGVLDRIAFDAELESARWNAERSVWELDTARGSLTADVLISGGGGLSEPSIPDLTGAGTFAGTSFHSAQWNHEHDLTGRRVAIIGTGASTIQFLPHVQREAGHVILFQRTPPWVFPHRNRPTRGYERLAFRYLARQVADPELRAKLTPTYTPGCKRLLQSNDYYPALQRPNVSVEVEKIIEVVPSGVVTAEGVLHEVDTIIYGTGFRTTNNPMAERVSDTDGRTLKEHWSSTGVGMSAYCGATIPGFPNFFMLAGPNTGIGHTSLVVMIEAQIAHVTGALRAMRQRRSTALEVRPEVASRWASEIQVKAAPTVWNSGGCSSWYLDEAGRNTTLWPDYTFHFVRRTRQFDPTDYLITGVSGEEGSGGGAGLAAGVSSATREPSRSVPTP